MARLLLLLLLLLSSLLLLFLGYVLFVSQCYFFICKALVDFSTLFLPCTVALVLGCTWPYLAVVKHLNT
jgi:hypothetical protein